MSVGFNVKKPKGAAKSYSITPYRRRPDGSKEYLEKVKDDGLEALNRALKDGSLTLAQAEMQFNHTILPRLKKESEVQTRVLVEAQVSEKNLELFNKYWNREYSSRRLAMNGATARAEFIRALRVIEPLSLLTASREQLQKKLDTVKDGAASKKIGGRLNQLLQHELFDRNFKLHTGSPDIPVVRYVTWDEFVQVRENIVVYQNRSQKVNEEATEVVRALCTVLFATGCRFGEIFPLQLNDLREDDSIYIAKQLKRDGTIGKLKNKKPHRTLFLNKKGMREAWETWSKADKDQYRGKLVWTAFTRACKKTFKSAEKHLTIHDLRHSYVIHMISLGAKLDRVKNLIGDKLSTLELYYAGFVATDEDIADLKETIREGEKRQAKRRSNR